MQREARTEREWGQWPGRRTADQGGRDRLKALFTPSGGTEDPPPSNGDDGDYAALSRAYVELDGRERRVRALQDELHALLREDAAELDRRQAELDGRAAELEDRRRAIEAAETTLADRRRELGAVELRRAAVERREEVARTREIALEQRAEELAALARRLTDLGGSLVGVPERAGGPRARARRARGRGRLPAPRPLRPTPAHRRDRRARRRRAALHRRHTVAVPSGCPPMCGRGARRGRGSAEPGVQQRLAEEQRDHRAGGECGNVGQGGLAALCTLAGQDDERVERSRAAIPRTAPPRRPRRATLRGTRRASRRPSRGRRDR